jgi:hypothetical protein
VRFRRKSLHQQHLAKTSRFSIRFSIRPDFPTEAEFDVAEELSVGGIHERLGHVAEGLVGGGP